MIEKKAEDILNPSNFRPISLTNTTIKLIEKLIKVSGCPIFLKEIAF